MVTHWACEEGTYKAERPSVRRRGAEARSGGLALALVLFQVPVDLHYIYVAAVRALFSFFFSEFSFSLRIWYGNTYRFLITYEVLGTR